MKMNNKNNDKLNSHPAANGQPKSNPVPKEDQEDKAVRRESMPPPNTSTGTKSNPSKSRRVSPPKFANKKLKVSVARAKPDAHFLKNTQESAAARKGAETSNVLPKRAIDHTRSPAKKTQQQTAPKVVAPTKTHQLTNMKLKRCVVRLPRLNLQKLQEATSKKMERTSEDKTNSQKSTMPVDYESKKGQKRKSNSGSSSAETWPNKKGKRASEILESKAKTRRLSAEDAGDETKDDQCEYIVPIDFSLRRPSRTSSATAAEEIILGQNAQQSPVAQFMELSTIPDTPAETQVSSVEEHTNEKLTNDKVGFNDIVLNTPNEGNNVELSHLMRLESISPAHSLTSLIDLVDSSINNVGSITNAAKAIDKANGGNMEDLPETLPESGSNINDAIEEMPLQLFVEDDSNSERVTTLNILDAAFSIWRQILNLFFF